jgi:hypothetical protein
MVCEMEVTVEVDTCCYADLNMPAPDTYGSQPPIELLRQWMDYSGWYDQADAKNKPFRRLVDLQVSRIGLTIIY